MKKQVRRSTQLSYQSLESRLQLAGVPTMLTANTHPTFTDELTEVNGSIFFIASNPDSGAELWKTDGTASGTSLVKDIWPGPTGSLALGQQSDFVAVNGTLFFLANDGVNGLEIWRSNGTGAGTQMITDFNSIGTRMVPYGLIDANGVLIFGLVDEILRQTSIWRSDGTRQGTTKIIDNVGLGYSQNPIVVDGLLYFSGSYSDSSSGLELWRSDGTAEGTWMIRDIWPGPLSSEPSELTNVNGTIFFTAKSPEYDRELWKSDGTTEGTVLVKAIHEGGRFSHPPDNLENVNGVLFFSADDGDVMGRELWRSDGTFAGTHVVFDSRNSLFPEAASSSNPDRLTNVNGTLMYQASFPDSGFEIWKSDGTASGTQVVRAIKVDGLSFSRFFAVGGVLYFTAKTEEAGRELWRSDGTAEGTQMVADLQPGPDDSFHAGEIFSSANGVLFFTLRSGSSRGLWRMVGADASVADAGVKPGISRPYTGRAHGSIQGPFVVAPQVWGVGVIPHEGPSRAVGIDIAPGAFFSQPEGVTEVAPNQFFFSAFHPSTGRELYFSDGTPEGTRLVRDIQPGSVGSEPMELTSVNGRLFFSSSTSAWKRQLWTSDGTAEGTYRVRLINGSGLEGANPGDLVDLNGRLVFTALGAGDGREIWISDGTVAGTRLLRDIRSGRYSSEPAGLFVHRGKVYFRADDGINGMELWSTDGTPSGTQMVGNIGAGAFSSWPSGFASVGPDLYFSANDGTSGHELWILDSRDNQVRMVQDIRPGPDSSFPGQLTEHRGFVSFVANDGVTGFELWKSAKHPGTASLVKDIYPGPLGAQVSGLSNLNGTLVFAARRPDTGLELWRSNSSLAGTMLIRDIEPGIASSAPGSLTVMGGNLYFAATTGEFGREVWQSGIFGVTTRMVTDFSAGALSSDPEGLVAVGPSRLVWSAFNPRDGRELAVLGQPPRSQVSALAMSRDFSLRDLVFSNGDFGVSRRKVRLSASSNGFSAVMLR